ncbi:MAG: SPOR domain-containing protein [Alistipes senegalensis]|nr:SPOR domain-containing protein [Oxalobacter formigenes]MCM1280408.1 SPOR domain-containing protein [Alistipes senegalensis]
MLKIFFWILLAANIVLFAFLRTYFDAPPAGKREPERLAYQYQEDRIHLLSRDEINREIAKSKAAAQDITTGGSCITTTPFSKAEAAGFDKQLPSLSLGTGDISRIPVQENAAYMAFIAPSANQKAAEEKIAELEKKGIKSYYLIRDPGELKWAVSLGVFKTREAAEKHAADMEKNGFANIHVAPRGLSSEKTVYRLNHLNDEQMRALQTLISNFPGQSIQPCQPDTDAPA